MLKLLVNEVTWQVVSTLVSIQMKNLQNKRRCWCFKLWLGIQHIMKTSLTIWKKRAIKGTYSFFLSFLSCSKFCFPSFLKLKFFPPFLSSFRTFSFSHLHLWSYSSTPVQQLTFNIFWQFLCWFHDLFIYLFIYLLIYLFNIKYFYKEIKYFGKR